MGEDFKPGDVAVYVGAPDGSNTSRLAIGSLHRVERVLVSPDGDLGLQISARQWPVYATSFRKLPKADEEFTASIRACKPSRNRVPA